MDTFDKRSNTDKEIIDHCNTMRKKFKLEVLPEDPIVAIECDDCVASEECINKWKDIHSK